MNLTSSNPPSLMTTHLDPTASTYRLILDHVQDHEVQRADQVYLTQPLGQGQVRDYTWRETLDEARRMARHLQSQGFEPGARIGLITKNCAHFIMAELAIWLAGGTTVALFPTESADNLRFVLEHSETRLLFVGKLDNWARQRTGVPEGLPCIALPLSDALAQQPNLPCWEDIVASTEALNGRITRDSQDLALLAYTSGSTGEPKGVMHSFGGISDASERTMVLINERTGHPSQHRVLSYLPLSHIFERSKIACWSLVAGNVQVFFSESLATFVDDLKRARPNSFISVPRLWLKFQHGVFAKIPAEKLDAALADPVKGQVVAKQVLASLGLDAVVSAGSGSAPISAELIAWYRKLGLDLMEGYAMTEDFAYSHGSLPQYNQPGYVGRALPGVQSRLSPEGEILVKSPGCMVGYYKRPDLTAEAFTDDGYFRTGDCGHFEPNGMLKLTGRIKELFKTAKGKYVAPAPIESRLNNHPMIELSVVCGTGQSAACALVQLSEQHQAHRQDPALREQIELELARLLEETNATLNDHEQLRMMVVMNEPWTIDNGRLTATLKIKRSAIEASIRQGLDGWYAQPGQVLWA
jgi:long-subunit acyl-CoA synthetase (AMP-forming)